MNEKVEIEIAKRRMTVEMEGLLPMQIQALANTVSEKIRQAERTASASTSMA